jgi:hypothetical protein
MGKNNRRGIAVWVLAAGLLLAAAPASARIRLLNDPVFLGDLHSQRWEFIAQGSSFALAEDHTRTEAAGGLTYGLSQHLHFGFGFPFINETLGERSKAGQGDLSASLCYVAPLARLEQVKWGLRQTLLFPTGFRESLDGFGEFSERGTRSESLLLLELDQPRFTLDGHAGFSMDDRRESAHSLWGLGVRGRLWREWLMVEMELGQELDLGDKLYDYQFYGGLRSNLPLGLTLKLGAEQRLVDELDHFGVYAGLTWHLQHRDPVRIRSRHLKESIRHTLEQRNRQPGFSLEPGMEAPAEPAAGPHDFEPVRVLILPFADPSGYPVSDVLWQSCLERFDSDSSLAVIPRERIEQARERLGYAPGLLLDETRQRTLGAGLDADFVLSGRILAHQPARRSGLDLAPLLSHTRLSSVLEAQLQLLEVGSGALHYKGVVRSSASSRGSLRLFAVTERHGDANLSAADRGPLLASTLEQWTRQALDELFYEYSVQMVVQ